MTIFCDVIASLCMAVIKLIYRSHWTKIDQYMRSVMSYSMNQIYSEMIDYIWYQSISFYMIDDIWSIEI